MSKLKKFRPIANAKAKAMAHVDSLVRNRLLPYSYIVYRRLMNEGKVVDQDTFNEMILEEMKVPQEDRL